MIDLPTVRPADQSTSKLNVRVNVTCSDNNASSRGSFLVMANRRGFSPLIRIAAIGVMALLAGVWFSSQMRTPAVLDTSALNATYLEGGRAITPFSLQDHAGEPFRNDSLNGNWTLLFFGFTNCPDVCPMTMLELAQVAEQLGEAGFTMPPDVVFVTVDPDRDTPERLAAYVGGFGTGLRGVTGSLDAIDVLARDLGIVHMRHGNPGDPDYLVDHGSAVLLISPEGRLQAVFQAPHRAARMVADLERILRHHGDNA